MVRTYNTKVLALLVGCLLVGSQSTLEANPYLYPFTTIYKPMESVGSWLGAKSITAFNFVKGLNSATTVSSETKNMETKVELKDTNATTVQDTKVQADSSKINDNNVPSEEKSSLFDTWNDMSGGNKLLVIGGLCLAAGTAKVLWNNYSIHAKLNDFERDLNSYNLQETKHASKDVTKVTFTAEEIIQKLTWLSRYTDAPLMIQAKLEKYQTGTNETIQQGTFNKLINWAIDRKRFDDRINLNITDVCVKLVDFGNTDKTISESNATKPGMFDYCYCSIGNYWSAPILWKRLNARATQLYYEYSKIYVKVAAQNKK